jgi:hypothetical protein
MCGRGREPDGVFGQLTAELMIYNFEREAGSGNSDRRLVAKLNIIVESVAL